MHDRIARHHLRGSNFQSISCLFFSQKAALLENAEEETPDTPEDQPENEDRPTAPDADANPVTQQPLPHQKLEEGKVIPSKVNQQDL